MSASDLLPHEISMMEKQNAAKAAKAEMKAIVATKIAKKALEDARQVAGNSGYSIAVATLAAAIMKQL